MNYFRGIIKTGEKSERALSLTEDIITMNNSNYNIWLAIFYFSLSYKFLCNFYIGDIEGQLLNI